MKSNTAFEKTVRAMKPRTIVQFLFLFIVIGAGARFGVFVRALADPAAPGLPLRPASVEAFLPISSLMSLTYFLKTGIASTVHPAGLVIFSLTLVLAVALRRGFCSWVCPVGMISEWIHKTGRSSGVALRMPAAVDVPLRALKYVLLFFFLRQIVPMDADVLREFIGGAYNRIVDVKMYLFFAEISRTALGVILILAALSILFSNFWCRYLCPYGALLGLLSKLSPAAVVRDAGKCSGCGRCAKACPNMIRVDRARRVGSAECMACYNCVDACPKENALRMSLLRGGKGLRPAVYGTLTAGAFILAALVFSAAGYWNTDTSAAAYRELYKVVGGISHAGAPVEARLEYTGR